MLELGGSGSKRKKGAAPADSDAESDAEGGAPKKKKKGAPSVDTSKGQLSRAESLHEEYMALKVDELKKIIGVNNMAMPAKPQNKDRLAWHACVFEKENFQKGLVEGQMTVRCRNETSEGRNTFAL